MMKKLLLMAVIFTPSFSFAQSSGMVWKNGAVLTAQQLQHLDNSKINTSRIGVANGVAPLDANKMMPAPVSGDISQSIYNEFQHNTVSTSLRKYIGGFIRPEGWGANMTGLDTSAFQNMYDATDVSAPIWVGGPTNDGTLWPAINGTPWTPTTSKQRFFRFLGPVGYANNGWNEIWDQLHGDLIERYTNSHLEYDRKYDNISAAFSDQPIVSMSIQNKASNIHYSGLTPGLRGFAIGMSNTSNAIGSLEGMTVDQNIYGQTGYAQQHQAIHTTQTCAGNCTDGLWGYAAAIGDSTGKNQHLAIGTELDITGNGSDETNLYRNFLRFGGSANTWPAWAANTKYSVGTIIADITKDGVFVATVGGSSASSAPTFPANIGETTIDGTVTWQKINNYHFQVGSGVWFGGGGDNSWSYMYGITGDGEFDDAFIDTSKMTFPSEAYPLKMGTNQGIQFSGEKTKTVKHTLRYDGSNLQYNVGGIDKFTISDSGIISSWGGLSSGGPITLKGMSKTQILAISTATEGMKLYDYDDHTEVTYRCPTTKTCGWFPVQYGAALSK